MTENNLFKGFATKVFEITTESSPASLTATVDGAAYLTARNLPQLEEAIIKLAGLLLVVISNTFFSKTFKLIVIKQRKKATGRN